MSAAAAALVVDGVRVDALDNVLLVGISSNSRQAIERVKVLVKELEPTVVAIQADSLAFGALHGEKGKKAGASSSTTSVKFEIGRSSTSSSSTSSSSSSSSTDDARSSSWLTVERQAFPPVGSPGAPIQDICASLPVVLPGIRLLLASAFAQRSPLVRTYIQELHLREPRIAAIRAGVDIARAIHRPLVLCRRPADISQARSMATWSWSETLRRIPFSSIGLIGPLNGYELGWGDLLLHALYTITHQHGRAADALETHLDRSSARWPAFTASDVGRQLQRVNKALLAALRNGTLPEGTDVRQLKRDMGDVTSFVAGGRHDYELTRDFLQVVNNEAYERWFTEEDVVTGSLIHRLARAHRVVAVVPARDFDAVAASIRRPASDKELKALLSPPPHHDRNEYFRPAGVIVGGVGMLSFAYKLLRPAGRWMVPFAAVALPIVAWDLGFDAQVHRISDAFG